eukprot:gene23894-biopygen20857
MLSRDTRWKAGLLPAPTSIVCAPGARARGGPHRGAKAGFYGHFAPLGEKVGGNGPPPATPLRAACPPMLQSRRSPLRPTPQSAASPAQGKGSCGRRPTARGARPCATAA